MALSVTELKAYATHGSIFFLKNVLQMKYDDQIMVKMLQYSLSLSIYSILFLLYIASEREREGVSVTQVYLVNQ